MPTSPPTTRTDGDWREFLSSIDVDPSLHAPIVAFAAGLDPRRAEPFGQALATRPSITRRRRHREPRRASGGITPAAAAEHRRAVDEAAAQEDHDQTALQRILEETDKYLQTYLSRWRCIKVKLIKKDCKSAFCRSEPELVCLDCANKFQYAANLNH